MEDDKKACCSKLSICNLGTAVGLTWGLMMFILAILAMLFQFGTPIIDLFATLYWGYDATIIGSIMGLFWGFVDGFIGGALVAFFYNFCACKCPCPYCKDNRKCCK